MKQKVLWASGIVGVVLIGVLLASQVGHEQHASHVATTMDDQMDHAKHSEPDAHAHAMTVTSERAFIEGMIPHHEEAVVAAQDVIARGGGNEAITDLANAIITSQEAEIAQMKEWYAAWYGVEYQSTGTYQPMMRDATTLSGAALDRAFLEDMIPHHEGALTMADSVAPYIEREEIRLIAKSIIESQTAEIATMNELLATLPE